MAPTNVKGSSMASAKVLDTVLALVEDEGCGSTLFCLLAKGVAREAQEGFRIQPGHECDKCGDGQGDGLAVADGDCRRRGVGG